MSEERFGQLISRALTGVSLAVLLAAIGFWVWSSYCPGSIEWWEWKASYDSVWRDSSGLAWQAGRVRFSTASDGYPKKSLRRGRDLAAADGAGPHRTVTWGPPKPVDRYNPEVFPREYKTGSGSKYYSRGVEATTYRVEHVIIGAAVWPVVAIGLALGRRAIRRGFDRPGICSTCGYDLRATPDRCPECGDAPGAAEDGS